MSTLDIPEQWTGEEALLVAAFLEELVRAIWDRHGWRMGAILEGLYAEPPEEPEVADLDDDMDLEDEPSTDQPRNASRANPPQSTERNTWDSLEEVPAAKTPMNRTN